MASDTIIRSILLISECGGSFMEAAKYFMLKYHNHELLNILKTISTQIKLSLKNHLRYCFFNRWQ
jgi:hypothetical protein